MCIRDRARAVPAGTAEPIDARPHMGSQSGACLVCPVILLSTQHHMRALRLYIRLLHRPDYSHAPC
eukprot:650521-Prorocentrum_minimum.AAC.2